MNSSKRSLPDSVKDYVIDNNPVEYVYTRGAAGRAVSVETSSKAPRDKVPGMETGQALVPLMSTRPLSRQFGMQSVTHRGRGFVKVMFVGLEYGGMTLPSLAARTAEFAPGVINGTHDSVVGAVPSTFSRNCRRGQLEYQLVSQSTTGRSGA